MCVPSYPRRRHCSAAAATCYTMELSTIPGQSHLGLGSARSINAAPSAGRGRHSPGLAPRLPRSYKRTSLTSHLGPGATQSQTCIPCRIRLWVMLAASLDNNTLTEPARSSNPSAKCRRSCTLGSPGRFRPGRALPCEAGARKKGRPLNSRYPT